MERSAEVEQWVRDMYDQMRAGNAAAVASIVAEEDGVVMVGTDGDEWWSTTASIRQAMHDQLTATGGFNFVNIDPQGYRDGDVAWFADQPAMGLPDGNAIPMRMTGVARLVDGQWRMVQAHLSIGGNVNQELFEE